MSKKKCDSNSAVSRRPGFLVDFSLYKDKHWPIDEAYEDKTLIDKLGDFMKAMLWAQNPRTCELGLKMEQLNPRQDRDIIAKCNFAEGPLYYASFHGQARGFVFGINSTTQRAYILGASKKHVFRAYHNHKG